MNDRFKNATTIIPGQWGRAVLLTEIPSNSTQCMAHANTRPPDFPLLQWVHAPRRPGPYDLDEGSPTHPTSTITETLMSAQPLDPTSSPGEDVLEQLCDYEVTILMDDSWSMTTIDSARKTRWDQVWDAFPSALSQGMNDLCLRR